jgi:hypothetical protein
MSTQAEHALRQVVKKRSEREPRPEEKAAGKAGMQRKLGRQSPPMHYRLLYRNHPAPFNYYLFYATTHNHAPPKAIITAIVCVLLCYVRAVACTRVPCANMLCH